MLWIESKDKKRLFRNTPDQDFIRFVPGIFECEPSDLSVWIVEPTQRKPLLKEVDSADGYVRGFERLENSLTVHVMQRVNIDGKEDLFPVRSSSFNLIRAAKDWPYTQKGEKLEFDKLGLNAK